MRVHVRARRRRLAPGVFARTAPRSSPAGADRVVKVWDARTLRETHRLEAQPDWIMGLALSADGKWLAAGRYDGTLGLYGLPRNGAGEHSWCRVDGNGKRRSGAVMGGSQPPIQEIARAYTY